MREIRVDTRYGWAVLHQDKSMESRIYQFRHILESYDIWWPARKRDRPLVASVGGYSNGGYLSFKLKSIISDLDNVGGILELEIFLYTVPLSCIVTAREYCSACCLKPRDVKNRYNRKNWQVFFSMQMQCDNIFNVILSYSWRYWRNLEVLWNSRVTERCAIFATRDSFRYLNHTHLDFQVWIERASPSRWSINMRALISFFFSICYTAQQKIRQVSHSCLQPSTQAKPSNKPQLSLETISQNYQNEPGSVGPGLQRP